nr:SoxR reducing system RseC family protein [uncultured Aminipila sp.]
MKTEEGIVIEVMGNMAKVKAGKHSDCLNCGACPGNDAAVITLDNTIGAKVGQRVEFEIIGSNSLKAAFMVFVLPLIFIFCGMIVGNQIAEFMKGDDVVGRIIGGIVAFVLAGILIKLFDRHVGKMKSSLPVIISIKK